MSRYHTWLESLRKAQPPPTVVRFQHADSSDYELPLDAALADDEPPGGMRCSALVGARESVFTIPRAVEPKDDAGGVKMVTAVAKAVAEATGIGMTQIVPLMADVRESLRGFIDENDKLRHQLNDAYKLAADRSLESVLVTAQEKASQARAESWDKLIALGHRVVDGVMDEHSRTKMVKQSLVRLTPETLEALKRDIGNENFAALIEAVFPEQLVRIQAGAQQQPTGTDDEKDPKGGRK